MYGQRSRDGSFESTLIKAQQWFDTYRKSQNMYITLLRLKQLKVKVDIFKNKRINCKFLKIFHCSNNSITSEKCIFINICFNKQHKNCSTPVFNKCISKPHKNNASLMAYFAFTVHNTCEYILIKNIYFIFIEYKMCSYWMCFVCPTVGLPDCRTIGISDKRSDRKRKYTFQLFLCSLLNNTIIKRTFSVILKV